MRLGWIIVVLSLLGPSAAGASSADKLTRAKASYEDGDYARASKLLEEMFRSADLNGDELRQAHIYLAASYYYLDQKDRARLEFDALFRQSPLARVDPVYFPPEIVQMANDEATKLQNEADRAPPRSAAVIAQPPDTPPAPHGASVTAPQARLENRTSVPSAGNSATSTGEGKATPPSLGFSFIPFGVGQFANEQYGKGALFLSFEVIALASFTTASALAESLKAGGVPFITYTLRNPSDAQTFSTYQTIYIVSFWTGLGIYVVGVVDSLVSRPSQTEVEARHSVGSMYLGAGRALQLVPTGAVLRF